MYMSEEEILRKVRKNGNTKAQRKIIAELNGVSEADIITILNKYPEMQVEDITWTKARVTILEQGIKEGKSLEEIAETLGVSATNKKYVTKYKNYKSRLEKEASQITTPTSSIKEEKSKLIGLNEKSSIIANCNTKENFTVMGLSEKERVLLEKQVPRVDKQIARVQDEIAQQETEISYMEELIQNGENLIQKLQKEIQDSKEIVDLYKEDLDKLQEELEELTEIKELIAKVKGK